MSYKESSVYNGSKLKIEIFGTSHSDFIGCTLCGLSGKIDFDELQRFVDRRKPVSAPFSTMRREDDKIIIKEGFNDGVIDGTFKAVIENKNVDSVPYKKLEKKPRPSHADFVAWIKYGDEYDSRGGGKFSGRMTAPLTVVGGICKQLLEKRGIKIDAYVAQIGRVYGISYVSPDFDFEKLDNLDKSFPLPDETVKQEMLKEMETARAEGDSVGGAIECVVRGLPVGLGETAFDSLEGCISRLAFAVPAVKGIAFGSGFGLCSMRGSTANDGLFYDKDGKVKTYTNHNGGINGGMANGMPVTFKVAIKPTPSIAIEQNTVDLATGQNIKIKIDGRHDACIVLRAVAVIEAVTAIAVYDSLDL